MIKIKHMFFLLFVSLSLITGSLYAKSQNEKVEDFVTRLYQNILNRTPDSGGFNFWVKKLLYENASATSVAKDFFRSQELEDANLDNEEFVRRTYKTLLNRDPESTGLAYWVNEIENHGKLRDQIFYGFALSDEFTTLCQKDFEILSHNKDDEREAFIERFYNLILGRRADGAGIEYWKSELKSGKKSAKDIAEGFFFSKEFKDKNFNNDQFLTIVYRTLMNREPDSEGFNFWKNKLEKEGATRQYVVDAFLESAEFGRITKNFLGDYSADIKINELMAANTKTAYDNDFFNFSDWIEIVNNENTDVNLSGYYISDEIGEKKYQFPEGTIIAPKGYMLIWADDENKTLNDIHTNFKLSSKGESVVLFDPSGDVVDYLSFKEQTSDISFGRSPGNENETIYMLPTPKDPNNNGLKVLNRADNPTFSKESGFYGDNITLSFENISGNDKVYYTLDGSIPTESSTLYSDPLVIDKTTVVRAVKYSDDKFPSKTVTKTYLIDENSSLSVVSLTMDPKFLNDDEIGINTVGTNGADSMGCFGPKKANYFQDWERAANITYLKNDKTVGFSLDVGVEIMGKCSRTVPQKSFAIKIKSKYGQKKLEYKLFDDKKVDEFEDFILRNSGNDWGKSMLRDAFMQTLVKDNTDIDTQAYKPTLLFLNGKFWGLYNIREKINKAYLKENHKAKKVDLLENNVEILSGDREAYNALIEYIENHDLSNSDDYEYVSSKIDIDEFIDYQIAEIFFANWDWPGNNVRYWRERKDDSKWRWIMYDTDFGFSLRDTVAGINYNLLELATASDGPSWPNPPWATFLLRNLLKNSTFKEHFIEKFNTHLNTTFEPNRVKSVLNQLKSVIEPEIPRQYARWSEIHLEGDIYNYYTNYTDVADWYKEIDKMKDFADQRPSIIRNQLKEKFDLNSSEVNLKIKTSALGTVKIDGIKLGEDFNGTYFSGQKVTIEATGNEGYKLNSWNGYDSNESKIEITLDQNISLEPIFTLANPPKIVINEFNYKSAKDFDTGDWVELYNNSDEDVNIGNWILKDDDDEHQFVFESNTVIPARGFLVVCENSDDFSAKFPQVSDYVGDISFGFGKKSDSIRLYNQDGILIDSLSYDESWPDAAGNGATLELVDPDSDNSIKDNWRESNTTTHGTPAAVNAI